MFKIHHDARTFEKVFSALLEHGDFFNNDDTDADDDTALRSWHGKLSYVVAPLDLATMFLDASGVCLMSNCGEHLIYATATNDDSLYSVELYKGSCQQVDEQYNLLLTSIRDQMLNDWRKRQQSK